MNNKYNKRLKNKFSTATNFSQGKAFVTISNCEDIFCINKKGELLFKTNYDPLGFNHANQTIVHNKEFLYGVMNYKGQIIIPCLYDYIHLELYGYTLEKNGICKKVDFEGKSIFKKKSKSNIIKFKTKRITSLPYLPEEKNGKWGIVLVKAEATETVIPFEYDYCNYFFEHELAEVKKTGKYGFINPKNEIVIPLIYDRLGTFSFKYGICLVEKDGYCGFIDNDNNFVIPLIYGTSSNEFIEGTACVEVNNGDETYYKYISTNGEDAF